ncbi:hypothetical protein LX16_2289 [Stackebrandtia albiflava]|uniref:Uncharacterized protein n=1 Tax=Stackebrandtia albiflava TaxID=406432 RepID=A0A562V121_9ACTN|nr:hypothetical protein [Stackebrandtia albiflava]TWJ11564.1 hypothetical protein LX16_2289 [Stackebrandtia albiflava]
MSGAVVAAGVAAFVVGLLQLVNAVRAAMFFIEFGDTALILQGVGIAVFTAIVGLTALTGGALVLAGKEFGRVAATVGAGAALLDSAFSFLSLFGDFTHFHPDMMGSVLPMLAYTGGVVASLVVVIALAGRGASDWLHHKNAKPELG